MTMAKLELSPLYTIDLKINDAYSLIKTSIEVTIPYRLQLGNIENAALDQLIVDNEKFGKQVNKNQKSEFTKDLGLFEKERISFAREIFRITKSYIKSADSNKKAAAEALNFFITPYKEIPNLPQNSKNGIISEFVVKYKASPDLKAAAVVIGLDSAFAGLEIKNTACDTLYKKRNEEYAARELSGSSLKPIAVASYTQFCTAIQQAANLTPNDGIIALFHKLDELRKAYRTLGDNGKDDPETPENGTPAK